MECRVVRVCTQTFFSLNSVDGFFGVHWVTFASIWVTFAAMKSVVFVSMACQPAICLVILHGKNLLLDIACIFFLSNSFIHAMLVRTISFYHFMPHLVTLNSFEGHKVSEKYDLFGSFSCTLLRLSTATKLMWCWSIFQVKCSDTTFEWDVLYQEVHIALKKTTKFGMHSGVASWFILTLVFYFDLGLTIDSSGLTF